MTYKELIERKSHRYSGYGLDVTPSLHDVLFDWQKRVSEFALQAGSSALFLDTGLGKTVCQLEWAQHVPGDVLILAPVAVAPQTVREGAEKLGLDVGHSRDGHKRGKITITNYERLHLFDPSDYVGVVLDESSILKSFTGKTKDSLCKAFAKTRWRLACTATPAPNDYTELGNHSEFLGVLPRVEMLAKWFINDSSDTGTWRLKGHAMRDFWEWVGTWGVCVSKPSDAGGDDALFELPPMSTQVHTISPPIGSGVYGSLFGGCGDLSATSIHADKRLTLNQRVAAAASIANSTNDFVLVWCESNDESAALTKAIPGSVQVCGSDDPDDKENKLDSFSRGQTRVLVTKPSIAGFGLNWQHCNRVVFASISYSYESFYQAVRRSWRFGQKRPVQVDVIIAESEQNIWRTVKHKLENHSAMKEQMKFATFRSSQKREPRAVPSSSPMEIPSWCLGRLPTQAPTGKAGQLIMQTV